MEESKEKPHFRVGKLEDLWYADAEELVIRRNTITPGTGTTKEEALGHLAFNYVGLVGGVLVDRGEAIQVVCFEKKWYALLRGVPESEVQTGISKEEAIGKLILAYPEHFGECEIRNG